MRKSLILLACLSLFSLNVFADEIEIPFAVKIKPYLKELKKNGVDLYGEDDSIGFIKDEGSRIVIYTYKQAKIEDMEVMKEIMWKHRR